MNDNKPPLSLVPGIASGAIPLIGKKLDEQGIVLLRKMLALAESGELLHIGIVGVLANGDLAVTFSNGPGDIKQMIVGADLLHDQLKDRLRGQAKKPTPL